MDIYNPKIKDSIHGGGLADLPVNRNVLINGDFSVDQRRGDNSTYTSTTTPANNDDTYLLDRWPLLSDGSNVVDVNQEAVGTSSDIPSDGRSAIKLDVETANLKFGIFQPIENANCKQLDGQVVSVSFKAKTSSGSTIGNLRVGIVQRATGSEDIITSDIVSSWESAGTDPTLIANWTYANTPSNLALTTTYQTFKVENITMGSFGNVGVFIWVDDTDATVGDFVFISDVQLELGVIATAFDRHTVQEELRLCKHYFRKTFPAATIPVQNGGTSGALTAMSTGTNARHIYEWRFDMRASPTVTTFNPSVTNASARNVEDPRDIAVEDTTQSDSHVRMRMTGTADSVREEINIHATAEAEL